MRSNQKMCWIAVLLLLLSSTSYIWAQRNIAAQLLQQGQGVGMPYYENYSPKDYSAHARNFDLVCDTLGHTIIANFEGLLIYDNARWRIIHTPGISRVTCLYTASDGKIWFGGFNVFGYLNEDLSPQYIVSDLDSTQVIDEVDYITEMNGKICLHTVTESSYMLQDSVLRLNMQHPVKLPSYPKWEGHAVKTELKTRQLLLRVIEGIGLASFDKEQKLRAILSAESGLCSNSINAIAYDGISTVWGATDNGIFRVCIDNPFMFFHANEGLKGEVCTILPTTNTVYVGTMSGIYLLKQNHFESMSELERACWMLSEFEPNRYTAATSAGFFIFDDKSYKKITENNTLSSIRLENGDFLVGELDGIHKITVEGSNKIIANIPRVTSFTPNKDGSISAQTLYGEVYRLEKDKGNFEKVDLHGQRQLFRYVDNEGLVWQPYDDGRGVRVTDAEGNEHLELNSWLMALSQYSITTIAFDGNLVWLGTQDGVLRFNKEYVYNQKPVSTKVYIRDFQQKGRDVSIVYSARKTDPIGSMQYSYRLGKDKEWAEWTDNKVASFMNLSYGPYDLQVRVKDIYGNIYESDVYPFYVPYPYYLRWYCIILYIILLFGIMQLMAYYRNRKLIQEQMRLEKIVEERTQQVVEQKNEIEEKTLRLEDTLNELKETQGQLLRQEREATVGKLTKGLIDRILNPLNYINNFSHLSIGLAKDLKDDIDDEEERMSEDNFEDAQDVIEMLNSNLAKIEQHGLSTTRILKAMEELLRDRTSQLSEVDLVQLCEQAIDVFRKYKADVFEKTGIKLEWQKPEAPVMVKAMTTQLIQTITSMLSNAEYALRRRSEAAEAGYIPIIKIAILQDEENVKISIYDNGIGMEEGIIDKIFDPFFTTKPTAEAPGVGLYLSNDIIQNHNGSISVSSKKDEFTEFVIKLPKMHN